MVFEAKDIQKDLTNSGMFFGVVIYPSTQYMFTLYVHSMYSDHGNG